MKSELIKPLLAGIVGALLLGIGTSAHANLITIDQDQERATVDCEAGSADPACEGFINEVDSAVLSDSFADVYAVSPSNEQEETDFLNSLINASGAGDAVDVADATRIDTGGADSAQFVTSALWFTIKTGLGNSFFRNNGGEIDLSVLYQKADGRDGAGMGISHVTFWGGTTTKVPAPGVLALFGLGLLGLFAFGRRRG